MAIENAEKTAVHISNWILDYAKKAGIKTLVLGLSGGVDSALVALLCKRTGMPLVCVNMPCHSSSSAFDRAKAFADEYSLNLIKVDLSAAHDVVYSQAKNTNLPFEGNLNNPVAVGGLRSCLRAPTLSFFANAYRGLIVGTGNRSEDNITRYFQKYGDGCVDISPIADLFKSEVRELFMYLATDGDKVKYPSGWVLPAWTGAARAIYDAKPTADLWGPDSGQEDEKELGISYDDVEWADRENKRTEEKDSLHADEDVAGIIFHDSDPAKSPNFWKYTAHQQKVIAKLHQMEKISRHKINSNLPVCKIRNVGGLVR